MMEKALLITAEVLSNQAAEYSGWSAEDRAKELRELALSSGAQVAAEKIVKIKEVSPTIYIGKGKAKEIKTLCEENGITAIIFNNDLSGTQQRNLDELINVKTVDRAQLILDIFARRAKSNEGKIQIELAQLQYLLPRLTGQGVLLSRMGGGIGARGPGEQKLEVDRRKIRDKIARLKSGLEAIKKQRDIKRARRDGFALLKIALIGYTNAGKSTLLNALTGAGVASEDKLFCTLDPTTRGYALPNNIKVTFSDTVGFLSNLPHHLIESFKATLEEVKEADLLLNVVDINHPKNHEQTQSVYKVLEELDIKDKPMIHVLNKIDRITSEEERERLGGSYPNSVEISALFKTGLDQLAGRVMQFASGRLGIIKLKIPQGEMKLVSMLHEKAYIISKKYHARNIYLEVQAPPEITGLVKKYVI